MSNQCRIDVESMPNRPLRSGGRGGFKSEVEGVCVCVVPNKPLTILTWGVGVAEIVFRKRQISGE